MKLIIATANAAKAREFREMLGGDARDPSSPRGHFTWSDLSEHRDVPVVEETGHTFRANACLKASYYAKQMNAWALADDSGLAVDALDGKPGVLSARWAQINGTGSGDSDNNSTLLEQLNDVADERRSARFVCVLALADEQGRILLTTQDHIAGVILRERRGSGGFGYDPLFFLPHLNQTMAELSPQQKHSISHRGRALRRMKGMMSDYVIT